MFIYLLYQYLRSFKTNEQICLRSANHSLQCFLPQLRTVHPEGDFFLGTGFTTDRPQINPRNEHLFEIWELHSHICQSWKPLNLSDIHQDYQMRLKHALGSVQQLLSLLLKMGGTCLLEIG